MNISKQKYSKLHSLVVDFHKNIKFKILIQNDNK